MGEPDWSNVLIVQTSFLGDIVLTLPLIAEVKRRFPVARVTLLTTPLGKELLNEGRVLDEIIVDDKRRSDKGLSGVWRKANALKARGFTLALCPHKSFRSALLLFLARIPYRVGFRQSKGWFFFHSLANRNRQRHDIERNLSILEVFGIYPEDCRAAVEFPVLDDSRKAASSLLKEQGVKAEKPVIGIGPGSVWPTKRWAAESFAVLIRQLKRELDCEVLLLGGPEDSPVANKIESQIPESVVNLTGKTSLRDLPAVLARCSLFISNDSGPMHIAAAIGVPVVAIFCATTPSLGFYPYTSKAVVLEKNLPCRPCSSHGGRRCPLGTEDCIRLIEPEEVFRAARRLLQQSAAMLAVDKGHRPRFVRL